MKGQFQWETAVKNNVPALQLWEIIDDISLIPQYHPDVGKVDFLSGQTNRSAGVKYQCHILEGRRKGSCVGEIVDYVPNQKMSVAFPGDSWGMSKMFAQFIVDSIILPQGENSSVLQLRAYYNPNSLIMKKFDKRYCNNIEIFNQERRSVRLFFRGKLY